MPLTIILRFLFGILSLCILGAAAYLLWNWYDGDLIRQADGDLIRVRTDWFLWVGAALLALSFLGRPILAPFLAKKDTDPTAPVRNNGTMMTGSSGSQLYVERLGPIDAPVIILTHGWAMDSTIWFYAKRDLAKSFHVICWDLPGMGKSRPVSPSAIGLTEFAQDLKSIMALVGDRKVVLVGHSIGGMTIQMLARDEPGFFDTRVAGTVLVNTTFTNPLKTMVLSGLAQVIRWPLLEPVMRIGIVLQPLVWLSAWQSYLSGTAHMANRIGFGKFVTHSQLNHTTLLSTRNAPGNINRGNLAMFRWNATGAMQNITTPLLVLAGSLDIVTKPEAGQRISLDHQGTIYTCVDGVNHMGFLELAPVYNRAIAEFAASVQLTEAEIHTPGSPLS